MSLRTRLLILVVAAMLVPAILVGLRFVQNRTSDIEAALSNLSATADDISGDLDEKIQGTAQLHYGLARARDLDTSDKAACSAFLSGVREEYPQFTGILTINPDGSLFCDSLRTDRTLDLRDRAYFRQALVANGVVTLEPAFGRLTGISVLQIAYPVRSETGELKFILLASFNLKKFAEFHDRRLVGDEEVVLVDRKGMILVAPQAKGLDRIVGRFNGQFGPVQVCGGSVRSTVPRGDGPERPNPCLGRLPLAFDPGCRALHPGRTIQGWPACRCQPPPLRGPGDPRGGLAAAARRRLAAGDHECRPPGRSPRRDGKEARTWRSRRAGFRHPTRAANWAD